MSQKKPAFKFAVCIGNEDYEGSLELHKIYRVIPDADAEMDGDIRIIDESGEDYLYPADWFVFIELPRSLERSYCKPLDFTAPSNHYLHPTQCSSFFEMWSHGDREHCRFRT